MSQENNFFGGLDKSKDNGCGLKKYLMKKEPKFYEFLLDECVDHQGIGTYAQRGNISFVVPSAESIKAMEKAKDDHDLLVSMVKSHIIRLNISDPREFSRFKKENDKEQLGNGLYVRLTVKEVKGPVILLDGGIELKFDSKHDGFSIYELKKGSMPLDGEKVSKEVEYGQQHKQSDAPAKKGGYLGGEYSGGSYTAASKQTFVNLVINEFCGHDGKLRISSYYLSLICHLKSLNDKSDYERVVALSFDSGSLSDLLLALYVVKDNNFDTWPKAYVQQATSGAIRKQVAADWNSFFKISCDELCKLTDEFRKKKLSSEKGGSDRLGMFNWVTEMYSNLSTSNQLHGKAIYSDSVAEWLRSNPSFKAWADCTRYYIDVCVFAQLSNNNSRGGSIGDPSDILNLKAGIISALSDSQFRNPPLLNKNIFDIIIDRKKHFINFFTFVRYGIPVFCRVSQPTEVSASAVLALQVPTTENVSTTLKLREFIAYDTFSVGGGGYYGGEEWVDGFVSCLSDDGKEALKKYLCGEAASSDSNEEKSASDDE